MKKHMLFLFLAVVLTACRDQKLSHQELVTAYYNTLDASNYNQLRTYLSDSVTTIAGDYTTRFDHTSYYEQFQWDSIFKSSYNIIDVQEQDKAVIATIAQNNLRNAFLKNNPLVYTVKISFVSGKISKIEDLKSIGTNWMVWTKERDALVRWIEKNHPELDGFVNDMTMKGSMNYLKAIELYTTAQSDL